MKKTIALLFGLFISVLLIQAQDLQEVLDTYFETIGQEKYLEHGTMVAKGKSIQQGMETDFVIYQKRPDSFRLEVDIQGTQLIQVYDGEKAWMVAPWTGSLDPVEMSGWQLDAFARQADFDGMLYNYEKKGYEAELVGTEDMEGTEVFKIKLTGDDGNVFYHFIDSENFVLLKTTTKMKIGDSEVESDTYFSNYNEKDGIIIPYSIESRSNGQTVSQINIEEVTFDEDIDDSKFKMPEKEEPMQEGEEPDKKEEQEKEEEEEDKDEEEK